MASVYLLYAAAGRPPDPDLDSPLLVESAGTLSVDLVGETFAPDSVIYLGVLAVNDNGNAPSMPTVMFRTDGSGKPLVAPSPVTGLRATPLSSGRARVEFEYSDRFNPFGQAASFEILLAPLMPGVATPDPIVVTPATTNPMPSRYSTVVGPLADGPWMVNVRSISAAGAMAITPDAIYLRADSLAPAMPADGLEAVSSDV